MSLVFCNHSFKGPFYGTGQAEDRPGVFVLLRRNGRSYRVVEAGYASSLKEIAGRTQGGGELLWAAFYDHNLPQVQREELLGGLLELCSQQ